MRCCLNLIAGRVQHRIDFVIEIAKFEQLQIGEVDRVQRFSTVAIDDNSGRPIDERCIQTNQPLAVIEIGKAEPMGQRGRFHSWRIQHGLEGIVRVRTA